MTETKAILAVVVGCAAVLIAILNRHFYWMKGWMSGDKEAPRWIGRLLFGGIGTLFILVGLRYFLLGY